MAFRSNLLLCTALAVTFASGCSRKPVGCQSPSESAECFVQDFYAWYTKPAAQGGAAGSSRDAMRLRPTAFSPAAVSALASDTGDVRLGFDPFLHAQSPCPRYVTGKVEAAGTRTRIAIHCMAKYRDPKPSVTAEVFRTDSGFQFSNFLYADSVRGQQSDVFTTLAELPVDPTTYYAHGGCPFECCRYGNWTMRTGATVRNNYRGYQDSIGVLSAGDKVHADSGVVVVRPMGIAIVTDTTLRFDATNRPAVRAGDTLFLLDYHGEGYRSVRWRDSVFSMEEQWDATGSKGAKLVREPISVWWVHMTKGDVKGWVNMSRVQVGGADACGGD